MGHADPQTTADGLIHESWRAGFWACDAPALFLLSCWFLIIAIAEVLPHHGCQ